MTGLIVLIVLIGVIVLLIDKVDQKNKQIQQLQFRKRWDDFSYRLLECQLLVRDTIDLSKEFTNKCDKALKDMDK